MGPDLDILDEILNGTAPKTVKVCGKFQPKVRPKKGPSVSKSSVQCNRAEKVVTDVTYELSASSVHALEDHKSLDCVNKSLDHVVTEDIVDVNASLNNSEILSVLEDSPLDNRKFIGVNADAYIGLESLEDPTTATDIDVKDSKQPSRTTLPGDKKLSEVDEPQDYSGAVFECAGIIMGEKEDKSVPCLDISDGMYGLTPRPELQTGRFKPKPKVPNASGESGVEVPFVDRVESALDMQEPPSAVSPDEFILDEFSYTFPESNGEFQPSAHLDSTTEGNNESLNDEPTPPVEISQEDISFPAMDTPASNVSTEGDGKIASEEGDNSDEDRVSAKRKKKPPAKSKKSASVKGKSVSKRARDDENPEQPTKKIPKRFPRSTRQPKRQVNKALLETPEDELDLQQISIRDIILLAEHREKLEKEKKSAEAHSANPSASNSIPQRMRDENATEQAGFNDEEKDAPVQDGCTYTNYHSYMERTPRVRWSKQDTELFYQAVRQFGSDLSFIQQLFPGRTRTQIKLKYKKEERQNPMMLHDALTGRAKDNSHFEQLIMLLKKAQNDSANNEDLCNPEVSGGEVEKSEQIAKKTNQVEKDMEKVEQEKEFENVEKEKEKEEEVEEAMEEDVSEIRSSADQHYNYNYQREDEYEDEDEDGKWDDYCSGL